VSRGSLSETSAGPDALYAEIDRAADQVRSTDDLEARRQLLRLRHRAGIALLDGQDRRPHPSPDFDALPAADGLPGLDPEQLTPELLRAGILRDGCVLVRGLVDRDEAMELARQIERAFTERDREQQGGSPAEGYYEPFSLEPGFEQPIRAWVEQGGGLLAADSPLLASDLLETFREARLRELVGGYLGEPPLITLQKTTLRKAEPSVDGAWHQDGAFMGDVRSLNLWLSLSRCGDESPGLDLVPRRLDRLVPRGTDGIRLGYVVSQQKAEEAAGRLGILRPIFEPGDALFFDDLFLHKTGSDPAMPKPRYAVENWFFGGSAFPTEYAPFAV
jgi:phytanoyl-CoA dioxygenase PhyH